jgi:hypothetical protein
MSCHQSASAIVFSGKTGFILVVKVKVFTGGIVPADLQKGTRPFNPKNIFPVTIIGSLPSSRTQTELEVTENLTSEDEFDFVEIFCGDEKPGTTIPVTKEKKES